MNRNPGSRTFVIAALCAVAVVFPITRLVGQVVLLDPELHYPAFVALTVGALLCLWLRVMAIYRGWHLPVAQSQNRGD